MRSPNRLRKRSSASSLLMYVELLTSPADCSFWIFCSSAAFSSSVASSLMKTSIRTRFLRLVAPWLRLSRVTRTAPRMAVLMNTVITAAMAMTQLRRIEPNASLRKKPSLT